VLDHVGVDAQIGRRAAASLCLFQNSRLPLDRRCFANGARALWPFRMLPMAVIK
jgi:hypothetical protein